jgi:hypothetical protein
MDTPFLVNVHPIELPQPIYCSTNHLTKDLQTPRPRIESWDIEISGLLRLFGKIMMNEGPVRTGVLPQS